MRPKRVILWIGGALVALVGSALGFYHFILDWRERPYCHKQFQFAFKTWMQDNGMDTNSNTNAFPNINGISADSLAAIREVMGGSRSYLPPTVNNRQPTVREGLTGQMDWARGPRYVPGRREG